jgi:hypothetical protein
VRRVRRGGRVELGPESFATPLELPVSATRENTRMLKSLSMSASLRFR